MDWVFPTCMMGFFAGAGVLVFLRTARRLWRRGICNELIAWLNRAHPEIQVTVVDPATLRLVVRGEEVVWNLDRLFWEVSHLEKEPERRPEAYALFLAALLEATSQRAVQPEWIERVVPRLVTPPWLEEARNKASVVVQPLPQLGLHVAYVYDMEHSVRYVATGDLARLGVDAAGLHARALDNLRPSLPVEAVPGARIGKVVVLKSGDSHDAARLLLVPELLGPGEALAALVPDRHTLSLLAEPDDWAGLQTRAALARGEPLLTRPVRVTAHGFELR